MDLLRSLIFYAGIPIIVTIVLKALPPIASHVLSPFIYLVFYLFTIYWVMIWSSRHIFTKRVDPLSRAVLITGCGRGFGLALAKKLHEEGYTVFAGCRKVECDGYAELKRIGSDRLHVIQLDVTKDSDVEEALQYVKDHLGEKKLWAVVNNAGIIHGLHIEVTGLDIFKKLFEVNVFGMIRITKAFLPLLKNSKGRIVNINSVLGRISTPITAPYCMSKFASSCFGESLRQEVEMYGIKVISVEPESYGTTFNSLSSWENIIDEIWRNMSDDEKDFWGRDCQQRFIESARKLMNLTSPKVYQVIDSIYEAVSLDHPSPVYKPIRNLHVRLFMYAMETLPKPFIDILILKIFSPLLSIPRPKGL